MGGTDVSECVLAGMVAARLPRSPNQSRNQPSLQRQLENFSREIHLTDQLIESNYSVPGSVVEAPKSEGTNQGPAPGTSVLVGRNKH